MTSWLIANLLALITTVMPVHTNAHVGEFVRWAGCNAQVVTSIEASPMDSYYNYGEKILYLGTKTDGLPDYVTVTVLAHEVAHCLQDQAGQIPGWGTPLDVLVGLELNADMQAANLLCALGLDGAGMVHDTFVWAKEEFDYDGDPSHGTLTQRIAAGYAAPNCRTARGPQSL